jgi:hypothetical protein
MIRQVQDLRMERTEATRGGSPLSGGKVPGRNRISVSADEVHKFQPVQPRKAVAGFFMGAKGNHGLR